MSVIGKKEKKKVDWESIEVEYRLGIKSIRSIAAKYNVSPGSLCDYAKRRDWTRDLTQKVQQSTKTKLASLAANTLGNTNTEGNTVESTEGNTVGNTEKDDQLVDQASDEEVERITKEEQYLRIKEQAIIEKASNVAVEIIESQREQIDQHRSVYMKIMSSLKEEEVSADNRHEMSRSLNTAMSSLTQAIKLQRQAYNMEDSVNTQEITGILDLIENETMAVTKE